MRFITLAQVESQSAVRERASRSSLGARGVAQPNACNRSVSDIDAAEALDRQTVWPTHRIRCFLQAQRDQPVSDMR